MSSTNEVLTRTLAGMLRMCLGGVKLGELEK